MLNKKMLSILIITLAYILTGCNNSNSSDIKSIKIAKFTDIIFDDNMLIPSPGLAWNMGTDDFLSKIYGAETMNPESEVFEEYRYSYSEEANITTFTPPVSYRIDHIPCESDVAFAFSKDGLYKVGYSWIFGDNKADAVKETLKILADDFNSNPNIVASQFEVPDLSTENNANFPYEYRWLLVDNSDRYIVLSVFNLKGYIVQITVEG